jgi:predicted nucleotidyltransferase
MLSHESIRNAVAKIAAKYPVKKVSYFGSYAVGQQTKNSDLDLLVEFDTPFISLLTLSDMRYSLEDELRIPVDVVHAPLPRGAMFTIGKVVPVYEQQG